MERRKSVAIAGLLTILLASFALVPPASSGDSPVTYRYWIMAGTLESCTQLGPIPATYWITPYQTRPPDLTPLLMDVNVTFSDPWFYNDMDGWIVNLTIPGDAFAGVYHEWHDPGPPPLWFKLQHYMPEGSNGYGWIFLNQTGDVDCYTFNNDTGVYWDAPGDPYGFNGTLAAATGNVPSNGTDGIAGTSDDGFGDGVLDPPGSSIVILPSRVKCEWYDEDYEVWKELFDVPWPVVFTTGTSYDIIDESESDLDGVNATRTGQPQEFYAGLDHTEYDPVPWGDPYCNAYVTYACCWSMLNIWTPDWEWLDVFFAITYKIVREDCVLADVKGDNEKVDVFDLRRCGAADKTYDESFPDYPNAHVNFDGGVDLKDKRGKIDVFDLRRIAADNKYKLTPNGLVKT